MDTMEYLKIILDGYISDPSLLKEHLIRNQKKAEKESFVTREEFIKRCYNVIAIFEKEIDSIYYARKNELYMCITLNKRDGKPFTDIEEAIKEMSKDLFSVYLHRLTGGKYIGHLFHNEVMFIKKCIQGISELNTDNNLKEIKLPKPEKTFFDYIINIKNKEVFADDLKNTFNIESGIDFKVMIELLKEEEIFSFTQFAPFFRSIDAYFKRDIGTQNGLNDLYKHTIDEQDYYVEKISVIQNKLNPLITKHKKSI